MTRFVEFTYKDENNKNATAYYDTKTGQLKISEYNQKDDIYDINNWCVLYIWIMLIIYGLLSFISIFCFKWAYVSGDIMRISTIVEMILSLLSVVIFLKSNNKALKHGMNNAKQVYNSEDTLRDILHRHDKYNKVRLEMSIYKLIHTIITFVSTIVILIKFFTKGRLHLIMYLLHFISVVIMTLQISFYNKEPGKKLRENIESGKALICNEEKTA